MHCPLQINVNIPQLIVMNAIFPRFADIKAAIIVGGMSQQKQSRMLKRQPEIVIATPGRLWELIREGHPHLLTLRHLK